MWGADVGARRGGARRRRRAEAAGGAQEAQETADGRCGGGAVGGGVVRGTLARTVLDLGLAVDQQVRLGVGQAQRVPARIRNHLAVADLSVGARQVLELAGLLVPDDSREVVERGLRDGSRGRQSRVWLRPGPGAKCMPVLGLTCASSL